MRTRSVFVLALFLFAHAACAGDAPDSLLKAGDAPITIRFSGNVSDDFRKLVEGWVHDAADAVMTVYGRYPVKQVTIELQVTSGGRGVGGGKTLDGRLIKVRVSSAATRAILRSDWVMTHEMFHLGFPDTEANWLGEGLSTYMEPLARARAGQLGAEEVWGSMIDGFPKGLPAAGDQGLDKTPTWGRTYWGGALFWLLADIEIRRKSDNHKSLDDVLRAIAAEGGTGSSNWPEEKIFRRGDAAIGMPILEELHERLGAHPETTDLAALWRQLGVSRNGGAVVFNDDAPLAGIRSALTGGKR
ncbi:MAG TPA: hypothetical protein VLC46_20040 [Thermoanaerobaculia bacterium]|jgi:hypothetical protein|nr:hypothetical protein [Thermoanaerobaculia bacterium]